MPLSCFTRLLAVCLFTCAAMAQAATLHGSVVRVIDGDTVTVAHGRRKLKVRLGGIDAPEKRQDFGRQSGAYLASLVMGRPVTVEWQERDAYGRIVGRLLVAPPACAGCGPSQDVGLAQIAAGYAWWYRSESRDLGPADKARYAQAENAARVGHLGLWAAPRPVPPWQWRHRQARSSSSLLAQTGVRIGKVETFMQRPHRSRHRARV